MFFVPSQATTELLLPRRTRRASGPDRDISQARLEVSARLRRFLATVAQRSATGTAAPVAIVSNFDFVPAFAESLASRLGLEAEGREWPRAREALAHEFAEWVARSEQYSAPWGFLSAPAKGQVVLAADAARIQDRANLVRAMLTSAPLAMPEVRDASVDHVREKLKELEDAIVEALPAREARVYETKED